MHQSAPGFPPHPATTAVAWNSAAISETKKFLEASECFSRRVQDSRALARLAFCGRNRLIAVEPAGQPPAQRRLPAYACPTAAERAGDLSDLNTPIFNRCNDSDCNIAPAARQQFSGNAIPTNLLSPQAITLLKAIPLPNVAGVSGSTPNYVAAGQGVLNSGSFNVRIDRYQTEKLHIFGRYSYEI